MTTFQLVKRNLRFYWRTNLAVILGVATAVAVLAGALLVGDSVRASLRDLFLQRLGNTSYVSLLPDFSVNSSLPIFSLKKNSLRTVSQAPVL